MAKKKKKPTGLKKDPTPSTYGPNSPQRGVDFSIEKGTFPGTTKRMVSAARARRLVSEAQADAASGNKAAKRALAERAASTAGVTRMNRKKRKKS